MPRQGHPFLDCEDLLVATFFQSTLIKQNMPSIQSCGPCLIDAAYTRTEIVPESSAGSTYLLCEDVKLRIEYSTRTEKTVISCIMLVPVAYSSPVLFVGGGKVFLKSFGYNGQLPLLSYCKAACVQS